MVIVHMLQQTAKWSKADETKVKIAKQTSSSRAVRFQTIVFSSLWVGKVWPAMQQNTYLKGSYEPPGFTLEHYKYKRKVNVLQCLSF